jgi:D-sedoheptulose 7-phosphate isomerase
VTRRVEELFRESAAAKTAAFTPDGIAAIAAMAGAVVKCLRSGGKILTCGNGGSACDAAHFAEEILGRFERDRPGYAATALSTDFATITAVANDYGFDRIFSRQVEGLGRPEDVLFVFSTSGNSRNILEAATTARQKGLMVFGLLGRDGGKARALTDLSFVVPVEKACRIQEAHILAVHILCDLIETAMTDGSAG